MDRLRAVEAEVARTRPAHILEVPGLPVRRNALHVVRPREREAAHDLVVRVERLEAQERRVVRADAPVAERVVGRVEEADLLLAGRHQDAGVGFILARGDVPFERAAVHEAELDLARLRIGRREAEVKPPLVRHDLHPRILELLARRRTDATVARRDVRDHEVGRTAVLALVDELLRLHRQAAPVLEVAERHVGELHVVADLRLGLVERLAVRVHRPHRSLVGAALLHRARLLQRFGAHLHRDRTAVFGVKRLHVVRRPEQGRRRIELREVDVVRRRLGIRGKEPDAVRRQLLVARKRAHVGRAERHARMHRPPAALHREVDVGVEIGPVGGECLVADVRAVLRIRAERLLIRAHDGVRVRPVAAGRLVHRLGNHLRELGMPRQENADGLRLRERRDVRLRDELEPVRIREVGTGQRAVAVAVRPVEPRQVLVQARVLVELRHLLVHPVLAEDARLRTHLLGGILVLVRRNRLV